MKSKPIFILANDVHLTKDNCVMVIDLFSQMVAACNKFKVENLIIGGDMFTNRSGQPLSVLLACKACFDLLAKNGIELHIIPGNHDKTDLTADGSYLDIFSDEDNGIYVINEPKRYCFIGVDVYFMPYYREDVWCEKLTQLLRDKPLRSGRKNMLVTHIGINGVKNNDGSLVSGAVSADLLKDFDEVFVGHYHNCSEVGENIHYTGSLYQNDYSEDFLKGFVAINDDLSFFRLSSDSPRWIKEEVQAEDVSGIRNLIEKYEGGKDNVRLIIKGKKTDCDKINVAEIRKHGIDVKVQTDEEVEAIEVSQTASLQFDKVSIKKDFIKFCSDNGIKGEEFRFGLDLIKWI